ncbi:transporter substrate-binding domain-containing protein [Streptococcus parasuis]|jgi:aspartate/glutamate/glutamine transport system substrate-binding protein|uniref:transporter substrate-binding domain-containing protein n=1 Tax=Streptococcus parasuis TaxID=1501662 RepID=UPI001B5C430C|nr:transporter substrate-binding domain-containing protein [Streptococcus parasuis]MBP6171385.1 transporter substrate-binding domain-containing protein [Streptococcus sp.]MDG4498425.1 transporter substrate-binding domain-containing protein [Streptococcus suis]MBP7054707.1 transporter substrate-binding domain-containing protein [Streptococcus sp.]MBP7912467.1 transporter substrate-binding domain-containing protein [Streptococcus sp.]MBP8704275.1 transporter substrate-binding domain-containing p
MKKKNRTLFLTFPLLVLVAILLFVVKQPIAQTDTPTELSNSDQVQAIIERGVLRVGVKQDVPNFGYKNPDSGEFEGLEIDIARKIADELGVDIEFTPVTAQTRGPLLDNGQVDLVIATFTITEERKLLYNFTTPYYTDAVGFLVNKDSGIKTFTDLNGKTIGVAQGSITRTLISELADKYGIAVNFAELGSYPELSVSLRAHRTDAFSVDQSILSGYIGSKSELMDFSFSASDYGIVTKLSNKDLNNYLNSLVEKWTSDGSLQAIYDANGLEPVTETDE